MNNWERIPVDRSKIFGLAARGLPVDGILQKGGIQTPSAENDTTAANQTQALLFGLPYLHNPKVLKAASFAGEKRRPQALEDAKRRILALDMNAAIYHSDIETILSGGSAGSLLFHGAKTRKDGRFSICRRRRSEFREGALNILLLWILHSLRLDNMVCGRYRRELVYNDVTKSYEMLFLPYDYAYFAEKTGMPIGRVKRHMKTLQRLGIVRADVINKSYEDGEGNLQIRHDKTIIRVHEKIFTMLGLKDVFLDNRRDAIIEQARKEDRLIKNRMKREGCAPWGSFKEMSRNAYNGIMAKETVARLKNDKEEARPLLKEMLRTNIGANCLPYNPERPDTVRTVNASNTRVKEHPVYNPNPSAPDTLNAPVGSKSTYNPAQDVSVLTEAYELVKDGTAKGLKEAIETVDARRRARELYLGNRPPPH